MGHNNNADCNCLNVRNGDLSKYDFNKFDKKLDGRNKSIQMFKPVLYSVVFILFLFNLSFANEFKTATISGGFLPTGNLNFNYSASINFLPPDGVSNITYTRVRFVLDTISATKFSIVINNKSCNPAFYSIPANVNRYEMIFDCTSLVKYGIFTPSIWSNATFRNMYGEYEVTYLNNPASIAFHGTEYVSGQIGKVWLQLLDGSNNYINNGTCFMDLYDPDNNHYFEKVKMNFLEKGVYYYDFLVPVETGVYPAIALCYYITTENISVASSGGISVGSNNANSYTATQVLDGTFWKIESVTVGTNQSFDFYLNYTGITVPPLLTDVSINWYGKWNGVANVNVFIWNFTSGKWILLPNPILNTGGSVMKTSNDITTTNATEIGILSSGKVWLKFNFTDTG
jgi:hypothetical protein